MARYAASACFISLLTFNGKRSIFTPYRQYWSQTMLKKGKIILFASVLLICGLGGYLATRPNLPSYRNSSLARQVPPGTTKRQLIKILGDPVGESQGWLLFTPSPTAEGSIRAKIGPSGVVEAIDPGDGNVRELKR